MNRLGVVGVGSLLLMLVAASAAAEGERTPLIGASVMGGPSTADYAGVVAVQLEAAWWLGRLGIAGEASGRWGVDGPGGRGVRAGVLGASVRLNVLDTLVPSLLEPSDVELGIELQGIIERAWWDGDVEASEPVSHGLGLALRLRGSGDEINSHLIAESRFFVRVMTNRPKPEQVLARTMTPLPAQSTEPRPEVTILLGVGASFGSGDLRYLERFRRRAPFEWE